MKLITEKLFEEILINPYKNNGYDSLMVLSGYGTPSFAHHHLEKLNNDINLNLIVGMTSKKGVSHVQHINFIELTKNNSKFKCFYMPENTPAVHAKIYIWLKNSIPKEAFCGSVNYSKNGFLNEQIEVITRCNEKIALELYNDVYHKSISCLDPLADKLGFPVNANIEQDKYNVNKPLSFSSKPQYVDLPLFSERQNRIHEKSGLNWGQRLNREPNQAYIPIPSEIAKTGFFPKKSQHFSVLTNEGFPIICSIAQDGDKAIHTPHNNSILGEYFRKKLNVPHGQFVEIEDLDRYGRRHVRFIKLDEEEYLMDF